MNQAPKPILYSHIQSLEMNNCIKPAPDAYQVNKPVHKPSLKALAERLLAERGLNKSCIEPEYSVNNFVNKTPQIIHDFLDLTPPQDPEASAEYEGLSLEEKETFFGCRAVLLEEGADLPQAERDAVAAVLQHRRLTRPGRGAL